MDNLKKLIGSQCQIIVGADAAAIKTGYQAYACMCRVADTQIKSITQIISGETSVVTDESFESVALKAGIDYITFEHGVTSITLNGASDSVILYLEPIGSYQS
jgi:hypothetical protein